MKNARSGMTLFELLVVMTIVGIVYSVAVFTLKKEKAVSSTIPLSALKETLSGLKHPLEARMVCDTSCRSCRVYSADQTLLSSIRLQSEGEIERYGFNRFGELKKWGKTLSRVEGKLTQSCFEFSLYPDGTSTPLILKNKNRFYAYTPLAEGKPFITESEEALRLFFYSEERYPIRRDTYYGGQ